MTISPRVLAFYLPQYHPIPENDVVGRGIHRVAQRRAAPAAVRGHEQPHLPADLGFYDLRARRDPRGAGRARAGARDLRLLLLPLLVRRASGARAPVRRGARVGRARTSRSACAGRTSRGRARGTGVDRDVLLHQTYGADDDRRHMRWLVACRSTTAVHAGGRRPLFLVYRASRLPNAAMTAMRWREEVSAPDSANSICAPSKVSRPIRFEVSRIGFDAAVEFQPDWTQLGPPASVATGDSREFDYDAVVSRALAKAPASHLRFPCVMPGWDNSPRRQREAVILSGSAPRAYGEWLRTVNGRIIDPALKKTSCLSTPGMNGPRERCWSRPPGGGAPTWKPRATCSNARHSALHPRSILRRAKSAA